MQTLKIGQSVEFWNDFNNRWETGWVLKSLTDAKATIATKDLLADVPRELIRAGTNWWLPPNVLYFDDPIVSMDWGYKLK